MAEPNPITWDGATVYSETDFNTQFRDALQWLLGHSANPAPRLRTRGAVATALSNGGGAGAFTAVTLDTVVRNRGFATAIPATIPIDGDYDLGAELDVALAVANKALRILVNGDTIAQDDQPGVGTEVTARISTSTGVVPLSAGDVVTIEGYNDAQTGAVDALSTGDWAPVLWIRWIGSAA